MTTSLIGLIQHTRKYNNIIPGYLLFDFNIMCICTQGCGVRGLSGRDVPRPVGPVSFLGTVPVQITFVADTLERPVLVTELHALSVS